MKPLEAEIRRIKDSDPEGDRRIGLKIAYDLLSNHRLDKAAEIARENDFKIFAGLKFETALNIIESYEFFIFCRDFDTRESLCKE